MIYDNLTKKAYTLSRQENNIHISYINGPKVEITGDNHSEYQVRFDHAISGANIYTTSISTNQWSKALIEYHIPWKISVFKDGNLVKEEIFNPIGKRVYIAFESRALGDTLAWIPYVEEFRVKYNSDVVVSTFHNELFRNEYPDISFVSPGDTVIDIYAMFSLGLFYKEGSFNRFKHPENPITIPMQKIATDILGLAYSEIKPRLPKVSPDHSNSDSNLITIAIHGTAQPKYWNNPAGWDRLTRWLIDKGYRVKLLSREGDGYMGNFHPKGIEIHPPGDIRSVIGELNKSKLFIGIGSGLSWLAWAANTPTVLISGFSYEFTEMSDVIRISPPQNLCSGCFNRYRLDPGDWRWCPDHKDTPREFECTKGITAEMVIERIKNFL